VQSLFIVQSPDLAKQVLAKMSLAMTLSSKVSIARTIFRLTSLAHLVPGMGGLMSITGERDGTPMKVGVAVVDVMTGLYASNAILAALYSRNATNKGQYIDLALLDSQVAVLVRRGGGKAGRARKG